MPQHRRAFAALVSATISVTAFAFNASCGSSGAGAGAPGVDASAGDAGSSGDGAPGTFGDGGKTTCALACSGDLHDVVDCHGTVITACPADKGCADGACVDPCASADANKSTRGCEFYSVAPDTAILNGAPCFAAFIANTWSSPVTISAEWGDQSLDIGTSAFIPNGSGPALTYQPLSGAALPPGKVAILFLSENRNDPAAQGSDFVKCPSPAALSHAGGVIGTGSGKAFHIKTDRPVIAYDIYPFGGANSALTSATLLLPTSAWDVNYMAVNGYAASKTNPGENGVPSLDIVASQPNTTVTIRPTSAIVGGGGIAGAAQGQPTQYVLAHPGDYLQLTQSDELTGSPIVADKPVGVWGAHTAMDIDVKTYAADTAHQQLFPVRILGHEYVATRYRDRYPEEPETTPWRLVGALDGTTLTYEPAAPSGAPTSLGAGQLAEFSTKDPFVVRSQDAEHPFYLSAHMTGCTTLHHGSGVRGDPEFVHVISPDEYLSSYVFFTDPTYPETNLVVVRAKGPNGFEDVNLDCAGNLTGWKPVGSAERYEYTRIDVSTGQFQSVNGCNNGLHEMKSNAPFGLTVWGWGSELVPATDAVSYAYPAGAGVRPLNSVVVPAVK